MKFSQVKRGNYLKLDGDLVQVIDMVHQKPGKGPAYYQTKMKSLTRGYGSMDYEHSGYQTAKLVKMDLMINGDPVDAFSVIVHKDKAASRGRQLATGWRASTSGLRRRTARQREAALGSGDRSQAGRRACRRIVRPRRRARPVRWRRA